MTFLLFFLSFSFWIGRSFIIETEKYTINYEEEKAPQKKRKTMIKDHSIFLVKLF